MSKRKRHCYICHAVDSYTKTFEGTGISRYGVLCADCMRQLREKQADLAQSRLREKQAELAQSRTHTHSLALVPKAEQSEA
jgi:hypothetical protein